MAEPASIATRVLEALVTSGTVTADQVGSVRSESFDDAMAGRALVDRGMVSQEQLSSVLEDEMGFPRVDLESYAPDDEALAIMPGSVARSRAMLPLFEIEGTLTVAIGTPGDVFVLDSVGDELGVTMDAVLAARAEVDAAVVQYFGAAGAAEPDLPALDLEISAADFFELGDDTPVVLDAPGAESAPAPAPVAQTVEEVVEAKSPDGAPTVDLDILAVADERKVAVLVADILEQAVQRGASRIHLLPYKTDFFLVFRIRGRLEKVASAPLSMQQPLIDGFKAYTRLSGVGADRPALGRVHAEVAGKPVVLTLSSVPTVAGQRLVVSITARKPQPQTLTEIGMSEAEGRALYAMVERGRGLLLVAGPVGGGRSTTYYSLLQHAAQVGKTVYSVERSIEYEIPAVAQVLVTPGQPVSAANYFAAGMRQDTDVMAIDSLQSVEDIHLAIEAAGMGKLVIATFTGGGIVSAVSRLLMLGAEPVSLASALTLGVGQRVVRTNCPNCSVEERSELADMIPGAEKGMTTRRGTGCTNCGKSGFAGSTAVFEVLPFTEPVRAVISRGGTEEAIDASAKAAGMRPMVASGLARVREGVVSPAELDRVLKFAQ